eukprot:3935798-Pleurochrysis_carterae.AAC.1
MRRRRRYSSRRPRHRARAATGMAGGGAALPAQQARSDASGHAETGSGGERRAGVVAQGAHSRGKAMPLGAGLPRAKAVAAGRVRRLEAGRRRRARVVQ